MVAPWGVKLDEPLVSRHGNLALEVLRGEGVDLLIIAYIPIRYTVNLREMEIVVSRERIQIIIVCRGSKGLRDRFLRVVIFVQCLVFGRKGDSMVAVR